MSSGIMEKNLPVAESLGSGDKVRIVTSAGNSKQIDASQIGGGGMIVTSTHDEETDTVTIDKTYNELASALRSGVVPIYLVDMMGTTTMYFCTDVVFDICTSDNSPYYYARFVRVFNNNGTAGSEEYIFYSETEDGVMTDKNPCGGE